MTSWKKLSLRRITFGTEVRGVNLSYTNFPPFPSYNRSSLCATSSHFSIFTHSFAHKSWPKYTQWLIISVTSHLLGPEQLISPKKCLRWKFKVWGWQQSHWKEVQLCASAFQITDLKENMQSSEARSIKLQKRNHCESWQCRQKYKITRFIWSARCNAPDDQPDL